MAIWAISDFHLSFGVKNKPMNIFGENWNDYETRINKNWEENIKSEDTVLMAGDFSWGMYLDETKEDFKFLERLPGKKIMIKGNHDYWWETMKKMDDFKKINGFNSVSFLHNNFFMADDVAICGTRGWERDSEELEPEQSKKAYDREIERMERSLKLAQKEDAENIIAMVHYNLGNDKNYLDLLNKYGVKKCIFGHLHGKADRLQYVQGGIEFICTSCDLLNFMPVEIK